MSGCATEMMAFLLVSIRDKQPVAKGHGWNVTPAGVLHKRLLAEPSPLPLHHPISDSKRPLKVILNPIRSAKLLFLVFSRLSTSSCLDYVS